MAIFNSYVSLPEGNDLSWLAGNSWFIDFLDDVPVTMRIFSPWPCFPEGVYPSTRLTVPESVEMLMCGTKNEAFDVRLGEINCNSKDRCGFVWFWRKTPGLAHVSPLKLQLVVSPMFEAIVLPTILSSYQPGVLETTSRVCLLWISLSAVWKSTSISGWICCLLWASPGRDETGVIKRGWKIRYEWKCYPLVN